MINGYWIIRDIFLIRVNGKNSFMLSKLEGRLILQIYNSAQLQIILLLECVRLHVETEDPLPPLYFQESLKRKKSRRKSKITNSAEPFKRNG